MTRISGNLFKHVLLYISFVSSDGNSEERNKPSKLD